MSIPGFAALVSLARREGADLAGGTMLPPAVRTRHGLAGALSIGIGLAPSIVQELMAGPTAIYAHHYLIVNAKLDAIALELVRFLVRSGVRALAVPASQYEDRPALRGLFPHKTAAVLAGLGTIGASSLLLTRRYGPRLRLVTVLTDAPLPSPRAQPGLCTGCGSCAAHCPAGAIIGAVPGPELERSQLFAADRCHQFIASRSSQLGAEVCGVCVAVCPIGRASG